MSWQHAWGCQRRHHQWDVADFPSFMTLLEGQATRPLQSKPPTPLPPTPAHQPPNYPQQAKSSPGSKGSQKTTAVVEAEEALTALDTCQQPSGNRGHPRDFQPAEMLLSPVLHTALPGCASPRRACS